MQKQADNPRFRYIREARSRFASGSAPVTLAVHEQEDGTYTAHAGTRNLAAGIKYPNFAAASVVIEQHVNRWKLEYQSPRWELDYKHAAGRLMWAQAAPHARQLAEDIFRRLH